ncbi:hypothetical protein [Streptomyces sp. 039-1]|uniref:hypothetical protein n=1 Tax=Streptomyces sp. 039-1 TaxID=2789263 RepID=UPI0039F63F0D
MPYLTVPLGLLALLVAVSGVAAISRGWVLPTHRRHVRTTAIYGWGQLVLALGLLWQLIYLSISSPDLRPLGALIGTTIILAGILVMLISQFTRSSTKDGGAA